MIEKKYYVYEHWVNNQCIYVGKGTNDRAYSFRKNTLWRKFFNDDMFTWFKICCDVVKIIEYFDNESEAYKFEEKLSKQRRLDGHPLTNNADGKAVIFTEEQKQHFKKIRQKEGNSMYGKKMSDESRKKMSESAKRRRYSKECPVCNQVYLAKSWNSLKCENCK